jgi:long-chain acyl-CoA synthetase
MKLVDLLINSVAGRPKEIAIKTDEIEITYRQMLLDVQSLAEKLRSAGCDRGIKAAIMLGNSAEYLISFFAISAAGGIIFPLSQQMTSREAARYIERADVSMVITRQGYKHLFDKLNLPHGITVICAEYDADRNLRTEITISGNCRADEENGDVALMVPTSGSTGTPKLVLLTDSQLISNMIIYRFLMGFDCRNVVYCTLSMHHIYCICAQILTHISMADTFVINKGPFFIRDFLSAVERYNITITAFVPFMAILLAEFPEADQFSLASLRYITLSGAKMPKSKYKWLTEKYRWVRFIHTYGMSEAGSRISIAAPFDQSYPPESVGRPMPGIAARITDNDGNILPANTVGQIEVKSSGVMKGYYKQPELTNETILGGWLKTGDIGKLDEEGNLFLVGRKKDIIISGGENIYPLEIEECLLEHPAVLEAAVVAQTHQLLQEVPCAFVVNRPCQKTTSVDIVKFCKSRLSSHKIPRSVKFVEKLPRLSTSKIDRNELRKIADNL